MVRKHKSEHNIEEEEKNKIIEDERWQNIEKDAVSGKIVVKIKD